MTEIDYSKVDWSGLKLPEGYILESPCLGFSYEASIIGDRKSVGSISPLFACRTDGSWIISCKTDVADDVLECVKLVDEHAKKWATKKSVKRTEVARFTASEVVIDDTASVLRDCCHRIIKTRTIGCADSFEIIINRLG